MWQINLTVHQVGGLDCPSAFDSYHIYKGKRVKGWTCSGSCTMTNPSLYNQCVTAAQDLIKSTEVACKLYLAAGKKFNDWGNTPNEHGLRCGF
jgi:hypothetical protein